VADILAAPVSAAVSAARTTPAGRWVALYDGHCRMCTAQTRQLQRLVGRHRIEPVSFQEEGILAGFPGVSYDACMQRLHVVRPDGRVFGGAEAVAQALTRIPLVGWLALAYYVPGVRQLAEALYRFVARNRYRIAGRVDCDGGTCHLHGGETRE
jgi:predicted DCC family thiol-disulfide oxidoreductase YuxK